MSVPWLLHRSVEERVLIEMRLDRRFVWGMVEADARAASAPTDSTVHPTLSGAGSSGSAVGACAPFASPAPFEPPGLVKNPSLRRIERARMAALAIRAHSRYQAQ